MKREDIEKAAAESAERISNIAYAGGGHIGQDDLETAFQAGANWFKKSLFHKTEDEVPQVYGVYVNDNYPQIPCLVKGRLSTGYGYGVRYWNVTVQCWDDEECDDYECDKEAVEEWAYLDDIIGNMEV